MKFSIFFEMQISEPTRAKEAQTFRDCVEQAVLADQLGYHCVWEVEHHGLYEYSHSSAPEIFLSFVAAQHRAHPHRPRRHAAAAIATTTRSASPSASPRSTSSRAGASTGARESRRRSSSSTRSRTT